MTNFEQVVQMSQYPNIIRNYVCAQCWKTLITEDVKQHGVVKITCPRCGDERGMVTREYADLCRANSRADLSDATKNLAQAMGIKTVSQNQGDIIKALYG